MREARFRRCGDVSEVAEVREEVAAANWLGFRISVVIRTSPRHIGGVVRVVESLIDGVLVVLLVLGIVSATAYHTEVTRSKKRMLGVLYVGGSCLIGAAIALEIAEETIRSVALLLLLFVVRESVISEKFGERGKEVLAVGLKILFVDLTDQRATYLSVLLDPRLGDGSADANLLPIRTQLADTDGRGGRRFGMNDDGTIVR